MQLRLASFFFFLGESNPGCVECSKSPSKASIARHTSIVDHPTKLVLPLALGRMCSSAIVLSEAKKIIISRDAKFKAEFEDGGGLFEHVIDKNTSNRRE